MVYPVSRRRSRSITIDEAVALANSAPSFRNVALVNLHEVIRRCRRIPSDSLHTRGLFPSLLNAPVLPAARDGGTSSLHISDAIPQPALPVRSAERASTHQWRMVMICVALRWFGRVRLIALALPGKSGVGGGILRYRAEQSVYRGVVAGPRCPSAIRISGVSRWRR